MQGGCLPQGRGPGMPGPYRVISDKIKDVPPTERFCGRHAFYNIPLLFSIPTSTTMTSAATQTPIKTSMYFSGTLRNFS